MSFIDRDGYINSAEFSALAREFDKFAVAEGLKSADIHFVPKFLPKYDSAKAKDQGDAFEKKRAQVIKIKKRMPAAGSRMKMVIVLRLYKGWEKTEFASDIKAALKAIEQHNKKAEKSVERIKAAATKTKEKAAKIFDKNLDELKEILLEAGLKKSDLAIGVSPMGKSMTVRLPNGGFVSIGKADEEKFLKAKEAAKAAREEAEAEPQTKAKARR